jgi:hypothetical protein
MNLENNQAAAAPDDDFAAAFAKFSKPDDVPAEGAAAPDGGGGDGSGGAAEPAAVANLLLLLTLALPSLVAELKHQLRKGDPAADAAAPAAVEGGDAVPGVSLSQMPAPQPLRLPLPPHL